MERNRQSSSITSEFKRMGSSTGIIREHAPTAGSNISGFKKKRKKSRLSEGGRILRLESEKERLLYTIRCQEDHIKTIYRSWSWRLTAPIRFIGYVFLSVKKIITDISFAWHVLRREGVRSFCTKTYWYFHQKRLTNAISTPGHSSCEIPPNYNRQYPLWIKYKEYQTISPYRKLSYCPLISILLPVYNPDVALLCEAVESVLHQTYKNWELCIVDDTSVCVTTLHVTLRKYKKKDDRIRVRCSRKNGGISHASNTALKMARGEFIALLDHDDRLAPHALYENVLVINKHRNADFIYSDEDKLSEKGNRIDPYFKPDWSPDLFLSNMYTAHLGVYRTALVRKIGGFRKGYEGSQDYDLVLRLMEKTNSIYHIPKILYHWRKTVQSTANLYSAKSYATVSSMKALNDYVRRNRISAVIRPGLFPGSFYVQRSIHHPPLVSIVIPFREKADYLSRCITSIQSKTRYPFFEFILMNNNSSHPVTKRYLDRLREEKNVHIYNYPGPFNFSAINNAAVAKARGQYILFLNNDVEVISPDWLTAMVEHIQRKEVGAVGAKLLYPNGRIQHAGVVLGIGGVAGHIHKLYPANHSGYFYRLQVVQNYSAVTAACMLTKKTLFVKLGGFNEKMLPVAFNDVDYCLRLQKAGYKIIYTPYAVLYHHESLSRGREDTMRKQWRFKKEIQYMQKTWDYELLHDPYYNPNLTLQYENFGIKLE